MLAMDTEFIQSFANTFLGCPCWASASELPCMWPVSEVCSCLWPHHFRWYRKNLSEPGCAEQWASVYRAAAASPSAFSSRSSSGCHSRH